VAATSPDERVPTDIPEPSPAAVQHGAAGDETAVPHRSFPDWSMGFRAPQKADLQKIVGYTNLKDGRFLQPRGRHLPSNILLLLLRFVAEYNDAPWQEEPTQ